MSNAVTAIEYSENKKLGGMSTTYSTIASCPDACGLKRSGACYGMVGPLGAIWNRLNRAAAGGQNVLALRGRALDALRHNVAKAEAAAIDALTGAQVLRIHTLGDCATARDARIVAAAAERYMKRHGRPAFAYTHAWRSVPRSAWGKVSVLASCETPGEVLKARGRGWATALVLRSFERDTAYVHKGVKVLPCPEQTGRRPSCMACGLCFKADKLAAVGLTIGFKAHGPSLKVADALSRKGE